MDMDDDTKTVMTFTCSMDDIEGDYDLNPHGPSCGCEMCIQEYDME